MNWGFWLALIVMLVGLVGNILPIVPGTPLIFLAILGYGFYNHFTSLGIWFILIMGLLTMLSAIADYLGSLYGAKKYGASRLGIWGSIVGGIIGIFVAPPFGILLGPLLGAVIGEMCSGNSTDKALSVGWGTLVGLLGSTIVKLVIGLTMILLFVAKVVLK
jgi:uncharacterized protein